MKRRGLVLIILILVVFGMVCLIRQDKPGSGPKSISLEGGAEIEIPEQSDTSNPRFDAHRLDPAEVKYLPEWSKSLSLVYEIKADQPLEKSVTIKLPLPAEEKLFIFGHYHDGYWENVPFTKEGDMAVVETNQLSYFGWLEADEDWLISFLETVGPPSEKFVEKTFGNIQAFRKRRDRKIEERVYWLFGKKGQEVYHKADVVMKFLDLMEGDKGAILVYAELLESGEFEKLNEFLSSAEDSNYETRFAEWLMEGSRRSRDDLRVSNLKNNAADLDWYFENNGRYPESLKELRSKYWAIVNDPITNSPYAYEQCLKDGRACYTLGANLVTDHPSLQTDADEGECSLEELVPSDCSDEEFHYCLQKCVPVMGSGQGKFKSFVYEDEFVKCQAEYPDWPKSELSEERNNLEDEAVDKYVSVERTEEGEKQAGLGMGVFKEVEGYGLLSEMDLEEKTKEGTKDKFGETEILRQEEDNNGVLLEAVIDPKGEFFSGFAEPFSKDQVPKIHYLERKIPIGEDGFFVFFLSVLEEVWSDYEQIANYVVDSMTVSRQEMKTITVQPPIPACHSQASENCLATLSYSDQIWQFEEPDLPEEEPKGYIFLSGSGSLKHKRVEGGFVDLCPPPRGLGQCCGPPKEKEKQKVTLGENEFIRKVFSLPCHGQPEWCEQKEGDESKMAVYSLDDPEVEKKFSFNVFGSASESWSDFERVMSDFGKVLESFTIK